MPPRPRALFIAVALGASLGATAAAAQPGQSRVLPAAPDGPPAGRVVVAALPDGRLGRPYPPTRVMIGGRAPYRAHSDPALPRGLAVSPSGELAGTPQAAGVFSFVLQASDGSSPPQMIRQAFRLRILAAAP